MQKAIIVQCLSSDGEVDVMNLNQYLYDGWRFVSATPVGVVGTSKIDTMSEGYLSVLVIIENDKDPRRIG
jgi:hypothetical protein